MGHVDEKAIRKHNVPTIVAGAQTLQSHNRFHSKCIATTE